MIHLRSRKWEFCYGERGKTTQLTHFVNHDQVEISLVDADQVEIWNNVLIWKVKVQWFSRSQFTLDGTCWNETKARKLF